MYMVPKHRSGITGVLWKVTESFAQMRTNPNSWKCDFSPKRSGNTNASDICHFIFVSRGECLLYILNARTVSFLCASSRAAQSAQSRRLHRACVHFATSGCVISARMCTSTSEPLLLPSMQTCSHSRGPVPPSIPTCTRKAPARCLQLDKARYLQVAIKHVISAAPLCLSVT